MSSAVAAVIGLAGVVCAEPSGATASPTVRSVLPKSRTVWPPPRVVHRFDFDERAAGNLEDIPKYWEPLRPTGFPQYAYGAFDFTVGGLAPPAFHLVSEGRNVAYHYAGPETRVRASAEYRLEGSIRGDALKSARACLSAHFLDKSAQPIPDTLVRSRYVGGRGDGDDWVKIELHLATAPPQAYTIGLAAWVLQEPAWRERVPSRRHIPRTDVRGGAWFDDITIYALPHAQVTTSAPGNVLAPGEVQELRVILADTVDPTMEGRLSIRDADGVLLETHQISVVVNAQVEPARIPVDHLPPGLYQVQFDVLAGRTVVVSRKLTFARLAALTRGRKAAARPFGVVVDARARSDPMTELALLNHQAVRSAKLPVWTGFADAAPTAAQRRATDRLLQELTKGGFALTAVFSGPPSAIVQRSGSYVCSLIELLSGDAAVWREHLAAVVAPYASTYRWWQIGRDGSSPGVSQSEFARAAEQVRESIRSFITVPRLSAPTSTTFEPAAEKLPVEQVSLAMGHEVQPAWFPPVIERFKTLGYDRVSVYVEPLPADRYRRLPRLAAWARRVIAARHGGAATVFVPQTWHCRRTETGLVTEPAECYVLLRTIADVLGDAVPGPRVPLADGVQCLAFHGENTSILALWDPQAPPGGRHCAVQLGQADRQTDLWGRSTPLPRDEQGRQIVHLSSMPVLVPGVERWLIELRTSLALKPAHVESGIELVKHEVEMAYQGDRSVTGQVVLEVPKAWQISPRRFSFSLLPRRSGRQTVEVHYPHNEPAGQKRITAKIALEGVPYYLEVPLATELGLTDLAVWGLAAIEGRDLLLRHVITNRSSTVLSFRGAADVPGRQRQYRPIPNLGPGDTQTIEYRFRNADNLAGRAARLVLRELNDGPRIHNTELQIP